MAIGRAIVREPKLFLFDEPLSNLDAELRVSTRAELRELHQRLGTTMIYVTHDQGEALSMSNRIAVFNHGRIEQVGTPREIYDSPATAFVAGFVGTSNVLSAGLSRHLLGVDAAHSIRPERIRIVDADTAAADGDVVVDGIVSDLQYLGADIRVRADLTDGSHLLATAPSDGFSSVAIGSSIRLAWSRSAAFTVASTTNTNANTSTNSNNSQGGDQ